MSSLEELQLDRNLYKTEPQTVGTLGADTVAANESPAPSTAIASGNSVTDVNTNAEFINGGSIAPGTIPPSTLDIANFGWTQTCAFSVVDLNTVQWGAGTFTSANGSSVYSIGAGNTGNMAAKTYIYLDINVSTTAYQVTTNQVTAIGIGKVLIAVCENGAATATYNLVQASQIVSDNILANTIAAQKLSVSQLSAISADMGSITAGTITGATIQTATTGKRLRMSGSPQNDYEFLDGNTLVGSLNIDDDGAGGYFAQIIIDHLGPAIEVGSTVGAAEITYFSAPFITTSGRAAVGSVNFFGGPSGAQSIGLDWSGGSDATIVMVGSISSDVDMLGTLDVAGQTTLDLTSITDVLTYKTTPMPRVFHGYVNSNNTAGTPFPSGWSMASQPGTGRYVVTHDLSSTDYTVMAIAVVASGSGAIAAKIGVRGSDSFEAILFDDAGTSTDAPFMFILCRTA